MKEKFLLDDWGPVPEPPAPLRDRLRMFGEVILVAAVFASGKLVLLVGAALHLVVMAVLVCAYPFAVVYDLSRRAASRTAPGAAPGSAPACPAALSPAPAGVTATALRRPGHPARYCGRCGSDLMGRHGVPCQACDLTICARCMAGRGAPQLCSDCEDDWYAGDVDLEAHAPPGCGPGSRGVGG